MENECSQKMIFSTTVEQPMKFQSGEQDNPINFKTPESKISQNYEDMKNLPEVNGTVFKGKLTTADLKLLYEEILKLPKINNVELKGNLSLKDLGIVLGPVINLLHTFDIEAEVKEEDVYSAVAILELMDIFGFEIYQLQEMLAFLEDEKEDKQVYVDANVNFNTSTGAVSLRNWVTENPYQVIDEANKKGNPAILRVHLYVSDRYMETLYMTQSIYSDTWWGNFKYFLGFVDDQSFAYLRITQNGSTTLNLKQF